MLRIIYRSVRLQSRGVYIIISQVLYDNGRMVYCVILWYTVLYTHYTLIHGPTNISSIVLYCSKERLEQSRNGISLIITASTDLSHSWFKQCPLRGFRRNEYWNAYNYTYFYINHVTVWHLACIVWLYILNFYIK